jgi:8-oxo-dGTP pyrophosphatase MutT (NUDIX family)
VDLAWDQVAAAFRARAAARIPDETLRRAAVAVILREGGAGLEILFIRRAEHPHDPWSGQMAFPGGRLEPGDADLVATAVRETGEELGLDLATAGDCLGALDEVRAMARLRPMNLAIAPFVFRLKQDAPLRLSDEVTSAHWLPLEPLFSGRFRSLHEYELGGSRLQFPCIVYEGLVIWGLTYRMFAALQETLAGEAAAADSAGGA